MHAVLVEQNEVFGLVGAIGTLQNQAMKPYLTQKKCRISSFIQASMNSVTRKSIR